jgi:hypothetical protein
VVRDQDAVLEREWTAARAALPVAERSTGASHGCACAVLEQAVRDERVARIESMISSAERAEVSAPHAPRREHGSICTCLASICGWLAAGLRRVA